MRLKYQLFITLLIASALLIAVMFLVSSLSFSRGFLGYINDTVTERLAPLVVELENQYEQDGNWQQITTDESIWPTLLKASGIDSGRRRDRHQRPPDKKKHNHPPKNTRLHSRLVLADNNKQAIIGRLYQGSRTWLPIQQDDTVVGYLGFNRLQRPDSQFDQAFERQQKKSFALAGITMVLLSALLAVPLAARIVKPIIKVKGTVDEISQGNYSHRITTNRRDEIGDLAKDINKLGASLEHSRDARQRLFAETSHELRTPVAVLQSELEAMQDGIRDINKSSIDSLHSETLRLNRLIDDLHTLSLADAGSLDYQMEPVNISLLIEEKLEKYSSITPDISVSFQGTQSTTTILADKQRLEQLIDNLMQNTMRYTDKPGTLDIKLVPDGTNKVSLVWSDSAPGVSTDALNQLFDPLYRTEASRSRETGGAGLGLSIVAKIMQAHNGTCKATHAPPGGLSIQLTFPTAGRHTL